MMASSPAPRIALVYDWVNQWGGAERVLLDLHNLWPKAPLYTLVYNTQSPIISWAKAFTVITSTMNKLPLARTKHYLYFLLFPYFFESFNFSNFDIVISVTSSDAKAIITPPNTLHLCYCLTPNRYLWQNNYLSKVQTLLLAPIIRFLQYRDNILARRPDHIIAISKTVKNRIANHYKLQTPIIYPGINTSTFCLPAKPVRVKSYFLLVSRLVSYKNVHRAIQVFNQNGLPLKIVGLGRKANRLKRQAQKNIHFLGFVSDQQLVTLYQNARALICPQVEDFGLTSLEAQACGTPVIANTFGGYSETVTPKTGILFNPSEKNGLSSAIRQFQSQHFFSANCRTNALRFSRTRFMLHFKKTVNLLWQQYQTVL